MKPAPAIATAFRFNRSIDLGGIAREFGKRGRLHIPNALTRSSALALHTHLRDDIEWSYFLFSANHLWEVSPEERRDYSDEQRAALYDLVYQSAQDGYAFLYETNRIAERVTDGRLVRAKHSELLRRFLAFLNGRQFLDVVRRITGEAAIARAEANCTYFAPGQFLAGHDDSSVGSRRIAYVFNLTRRWRPEWGGLLEFRGQTGHIEEAYVPVFNSLNLFRVPMAHSVSCVAPFAAEKRLAVSGWFHSQ